MEPEFVTVCRRVSVFACESPSLDRGTMGRGATFGANEIRSRLPHLLPITLGRIFSPASGSDDAGQFVVDAHDHAHGLPGAQPSAGGSTHTCASYQRPARPTGSVKDVGVERIVVCTNPDASANELTRSLRCTTGVVIDFAAEGVVSAPVATDPRSSAENAHIDSRVESFCKAHHHPRSFPECTIRLATSGSTDVDETLPCAVSEPIDQRSEAGCVYGANHAAVVIGSAARRGGSRGRKVGKYAPSCTVVKRPGETTGGVS